MDPQIALTFRLVLALGIDERKVGQNSQNMLQMRKENSE